MLTLSEQSNKAFRRLVQLADFERLSICTAIIKLISCDDMDDDGALNNVYLLAPLTDGYMELRPSETVYLMLVGCFPNID